MKMICVAVGFYLALPLTTHAKESAEAHDHAHAVVQGASAQQAKQWLSNGNIRFTTAKYRRDGKSMADIKKLAGGQKPHSVILSCADSRVPPELLFDQSLGEIFVIRVAGEALDSSVIASIEYAVAHLGTKNIVVMGHTQCGAIKAAMGAKKGTSSGSSSLDALVADILPRLSEGVSSSSDVTKESSANAMGVAQDLIERSKIIAEGVKSGAVEVSSALYHLEDGKVSWLK